MNDNSHFGGSALNSNQENEKVEAKKSFLKRTLKSLFVSDYAEDVDPYYYSSN